MRLGKMKERREEIGLTQAEVAARVGTNQARVSNLERGLSVRKATAVKFAKALGCRVEDLKE